MPGEATKFKGKGRLDIDDPTADRASAQWQATVGEPPDPAGVLAGAVTVWKRGTNAPRASMREFTLMKHAFPENFNLRLSGITENFRSPPAHPRVYWLSDEPLRQAAADGSLAKPERLAAEVRRMLADPRSEALARQSSPWTEPPFEVLRCFLTNTRPCQTA